MITDIGRTTLLDNHPDVDRVIAFNRQKKPLLKYLKSLVNLLKHLRQIRYDLMINLYGGGSSTQITKLSRAKHRWGFYYKDKHKTVYTHGYKAVDTNANLAHWGQALGSLLSPFDIEPKDLRAGTTFIPTTTARQQAKTILHTVAKPWVLFNMGAGDIRKMWPVKNYFCVAKWLQATYGYHIGVFVNPNQEYLAEEFKQLAQQTNWTGFTLLNINDFSVIGALLEQAQCFLTGDTGLLHLAFGVKTPTVAILTHTRPEHIWPEDVNALYCFLEDENKTNSYGIKMGKAEIPIAYVKEK